jgi:hypothetical protein
VCRGLSLIRQDFDFSLTAPRRPNRIPSVPVQVGSPVGTTKPLEVTVARVNSLAGIESGRMLML